MVTSATLPNSPVARNTLGETANAKPAGSTTDHGESETRAASDSMKAKATPDPKSRSMLEVAASMNKIAGKTVMYGLIAVPIIAVNAALFGIPGLLHAAWSNRKSRSEGAQGEGAMGAEGASPRNAVEGEDDDGDDPGQAEGLDKSNARSGRTSREGEPGLGVLPQTSHEELAAMQPADAGEMDDNDEELVIHGYEDLPVRNPPVIEGGGQPEDGANGSPPAQDPPLA